MLAREQIQSSLKSEFGPLTIVKNKDYLEIEAMYEGVQEKFAAYVYMQALIKNLHQKRKQGMTLYWKV